jgi:putative transferase (TIGR04331 family)
LDGSEDDLLRVLKTLIFEVIPVRYLEGFSMIRELASKEQWPQKPKFIFTSNAFYSSDILKYWLASKVESGTKYFVGQHGNSYFTDRRQRYCIEETTADHFLTWGWTDGTNKYIPTFVFQGKIVCKSKDNQSGGLLLINSGPAPSRTTYDVSSLSEEYFQMNKKFLENLNHAPRNGTILRLYAGSSRHAFSEKNRWRDFDPNLTVDDGFTQINALINESRLVVHSYDSTGMLLSLSQNIPTLAYWINGFDHLSSEVVEDYNLLLEAGIIHLSGESAAQKVNEIWESIDEWWQQKDLQHARKVFCQKYARVSSQKVRGLRKALKS